MWRCVAGLAFPEASRYPHVIFKQRWRNNVRSKHPEALKLSVQICQRCRRCVLHVTARNQSLSPHFSVSVTAQCSADLPRYEAVFSDNVVTLTVPSSFQPDVLQPSVNAILLQSPFSTAPIILLFQTCCIRNRMVRSRNVRSDKPSGWFLEGC